MLERAVIRVWANEPPQFQGSAFLIAPGCAITAKHVVAHLPYESVYLTGPPWSGQRKLAQAPLLHPHRDVALLKLAQADAQDWISLAANTVTLQPGQTVMVAGYSTPEQDLERLSLAISSYDGQTNALVLHTFIGRGISGGPVLLDEQLVGLLYARDTDHNRSYIIPLAAFRDFIHEEAARVEPNQPDSKIHPNPFNDQGCIEDRHRFFRREQILHEIFEELGKGTNLALLGDTQSGKSSLLFHVYQSSPTQLNLPAYYLNMQWLTDEADFFTALCTEMKIPPARGYALHRALRGKRCILCLDEIERMNRDQRFSIDIRSELRGLADGNQAPLTLLIASRSPLAELFPDTPLTDSPLNNICHSKIIPPLSLSEVQTFINARLQPTSIRFSNTDIKAIWEASQGNPFKVQTAAAKLYQQYQLGS